MSEVLAGAFADHPGTDPQRRRPGVGFAALTGPWAPVVIGLCIAVAASLTWLQWWRPYLEHDDWDMLLPNGPAFVENHAARLLHEGRWLNDWWWSLGSQGLSPREAVLLYAAGWLIVVAILVRSLSIGWWSVPTAIALYAAPMMSMLSYWPATTAAPMLTTALTCVLLWLTRQREAIHLAVLAVGTIIIVLGYPPLALLLLPLLAVLHQRKSWRQLAVIAGTIVLAYVAGILIMFTLNAIRFGHFGLQIQQWRDPSALNSLPSLGHHLRTVASNWGSVLRPLTLPLFAFAAALAAAVRESRLRRRLVVAAGALLGGITLSASSTITNGVNVPSRAMGWFWLLLVLVVVWSLETVRPRARVVAALALAFITIWSVLYVAFAALGHQPDRAALTAMRQAIVAHHQVDPGAPVYFAVADPRPTPAERQAVWEVGNQLAKFDGITALGQCHGCRLTTTSVDPRHPGTWIFDIRDAIVVQFPATIQQAPLHAQPQPRWLVPFD